MLTKIMKWSSIAALLLAALWRPSENYQILLQVVVCASALLVAGGGGMAQRSIFGRRSLERHRNEREKPWWKKSKPVPF